ncbi:hypothetical protein HMPREF9386_0918 [Streptococcus sanguinis SK330]|uniref:Uncharacterized protein n=1 Tax=Streptococcus sanguinis SK330 TaxID=888813 RepID=F2C6N8_STRSA|nr:hypothetical protein HMPREF9386_0918 [Streptococcus sanguinis SK330]
MCKDITMDIFDLGSTLIDEREIYHLFLENCLEVVCRAGHALSLEKLEDKMTVFLSENIIKRSLRFLVATCLKK